MILVPPSEVALISPLLVLQRCSMNTLRLARSSRCDLWDGYEICSSPYCKMSARFCVRRGDNAALFGSDGPTRRLVARSKHLGKHFQQERRVLNSHQPICKWSKGRSTDSPPFDTTD